MLVLVLWDLNPKDGSFMLEGENSSELGIVKQGEASVERYVQEGASVEKEKEKEEILKQ